VALARISAGSDDQQAGGPPAAKTSTVTKTDLGDQLSVTGTVGYGADRPLDGRKPGTLTALPEPGAVVERGRSLYSVAGKPVPLFYGGTPLYRELAPGVTAGPDVTVLEQNLAALGFRDMGAPDDTFTERTATALRKWQKAAGLVDSGRIEPVDVVVAPGAVRVREVTAQLGAEAAGRLMTVSGTERLVSVPLEVAKQGVAKVGAKVEVELPGGRTTTGTVRVVGTVTGGGKDDKQGQDDGKPKINVTVALDDPAAAGQLDSAPVSVRFTAETRQGVLAVPIGALLALREGGYAVEVVDGDRRRLLPVRTGLFAKGQVEVSGDGLTEGMTVVTAS
jgi:peptidoglycan hydrolase-like protein with peptidoglycan-binding domain